MESITKAIQSSGASEALTYLKGITNKVKQYALQLSEVEVKVEDATNNDPWGPHGTVMAEITRAAYDIESYRQIMGVLARRLQDQGEDWRHVYKSLLLLEYMAKHGPQKVVEELVSNVGVVEKLTSFQHKDANGRDWGLNVRQRAKELAALVIDPDRIRAERQKAKANEKKYTGVSSEEARFGSFGGRSGGGANGFGGGGLSSASGLGGSGRTGGGGGGGSAWSSGGGRFDDHDDDELEYDKDPKEATRERIAALKAAGELADGAPRDLGAIPPAPRAPGAAPAPKPGADGARGPKKLSDIKVDPTIAASLCALPLPATAAPRAAASPAVGSGPKPAAGPGRAAAPAAPAVVVDLLGGLEGPPAAPAAGAAGSSSNGASTSAWDAFGAAPAAAAPTDDWSSFAAPAAPAASAAPAPAAHSDPFEALAAAPAHAPAAAQLVGDPFAPAPSAHAPNPGADPFAPCVPIPGRAPAPSARTLQAGPGGALPEDMFTVGLGVGSGLAPQPAPAVDAGLGFGGLQAGAAAVPAASPGGFATWGAPPAPSAPAPAPAQAPASEQAQALGMRTSALRPGKKDPFADLTAF
ncbi:hypothetical protein WJX81_005031 [Elliptochloris bilobata]|uniref:ENTH domain-containing protein n=1 Tax=Elliptochloris bilobata TaxID=381761 RepID=A0AAW1RP26_9CHLO